MVQDNIADMLTRMRNALQMRYQTVVVNGTKMTLRVYAKANEIPRVLNGLGIAIISTSKGLMTDKEARENNLGGEVLAYIW